MFSHHNNRQRMEPGSGLCFCTLTITPSGGKTCKIISNCKIVQNLSYHAIFSRFHHVSGPEHAGDWLCALHQAGNDTQMETMMLVTD